MRILLVVPTKQTQKTHSHTGRDAGGTVRTHKHRRPTACTCQITALEPNEACPIHGAGEWLPRCAECGRLLPWRAQMAKEEP